MSIVKSTFSLVKEPLVRKYGIPAVVIAVLASGGVALANGHSPRPSREKGHVRVIKVFALTVQFKMIDLGDPGFSLGDQAVFSDNLLTSKNGSVVGYDGGVCTVVRVVNATTGTGTLQCPVTFSLSNGQIATQGLVQLTNGQFTGTQTTAITGGTGSFREARGQATVEFLSNTEANITFFVAR
ncbi:MAG: hypothetical protein JOZ98_13820 [Solirubrobacterales bacterium]|nr:hypothetical protein [Solirubrobacterales bacterium]MBV9801356.1 hypothetical protein [Solirubrobacterales bacterium]